MKAVTAITWELDNIPLAVSQLREQVETRITLLQNSVGILFCNWDMDTEGLIQGLEKAFSFPIVGCTTMGVLEGSAGFNETSASLTVLTAEDCRLQIALSQPLNCDNAQSVVEEVYSRAVKALGETPKMMFVLPPYRQDIMLDVYPEVLGQVSGGVPVFGGVPSGSGEDASVGAEGMFYRDRMVLLLIGGEISPVFSVRNIHLQLVAQKRTVTSARDNIIYRVGDKTFVEYMREIGLKVDFAPGEDTSFAFVPNPLLVEMPDDGQDGGVPLARTIHSLNVEDGSGITIGKVPQGATISVGVLNREDIQSSTEAAIGELLQKIGEKERLGNSYSIVFCATCIGRFLVMAPECGLEAEALIQAINGRLPISGFYCYGELCPTSKQGAAADNKAHNETITLCAL